MWGIALRKSPHYGGRMDHTLRATLTAEQAALLEAHGMPLPTPHASTVHRRRAKTERAFPVISRSGRRYTQPDGRTYGETEPADQRQADAGYWRVGVGVRNACEPMTVAVGGIVKRIYQVQDWLPEPGGSKWIADLGPELSDDDLDRDYPDYPYRRGRACETRKGGAYRPEYY